MPSKYSKSNIFLLILSHNNVFSNMTPQILKLIEKLLQPLLPEDGSLFVGNLIIVTFANVRKSVTKRLDKSFRMFSC